VTNISLIEAKKKANEKWNEKNKDRVKYLSWRARAKSFIEKAATLEDLEELEELIREKKEKRSQGD
jgi:hypothetical protein